MNAHYIIRFYFFFSFRSGSNFPQHSCMFEINQALRLWNNKLHKFSFLYSDSSMPLPDSIAEMIQI